MIKGSNGVEYGATEWQTYTLQAFLDISLFSFSLLTAYKLYKTNTYCNILRKPWCHIINKRKQRCCQYHRHVRAAHLLSTLSTQSKGDACISASHRFSSGRRASIVNTRSTSNADARVAQWQSSGGGSWLAGVRTPVLHRLLVQAK